MRPNKTLETHTPSRTARLLRVDASARYADSVTRALTDATLDALRRRHGGNVQTRVRDLAAEPLPFLDARWVGATFTPVDQRTPEQRRALQVSDQLVYELQDSDVLVIGAPVYNFGIPAALKAWIDLIARAGVTFRYTDAGVEGLLEGKQAYVVIASGGVAVGSEVDFASTYLRHVLGFLGIRDVEIIAADGLVQRPRTVEDAHRRIRELVGPDRRPVAQSA